jgi:hypothetical protein
MGGNQQDYDEWVTARTLIDTLDDRMNDLRKVGFTFVTGILAVSGIFLPETTEGGLSYGIKAAIIIVTLALIVALALFEKNNFIVQRAASQRALVLERRLNLELTEIISYQYRFNKGSRYKNLIYVLFIFGACTFAYTLPIDSNPTMNFIKVLLMFIFFAGIIGLIQSRFKFRRPKTSEGQDWTLDKIECQQGDMVGITLTNFSGDEISISPNDIAYKIEDKEGNIIFQDIVKNTIKLQNEQSYTWYWDTTGVKPGIYQIIPRGEGDPLIRIVRFLEKFSKSPKPN